MSTWQIVVMVLAGGLATQLCRWVAFVLFPTAKKTPRLVTYLGKVLPGAIWGLLIIYSFRTCDPLTGFHMIPELIAAAVVVVLHLWKHNMALSMVAGTAVYMVLIRTLFVG